MILKYIILKNKNTPILFPREPFSHYEVAYSLGDVISAGFCVIRIKEEKLQIKCFGESLTLAIKSNPGKNGQIDHHFPV